MEKKEILAILKRIQTKFEDGLEAEYELHANDEDQVDARIIEASIELERLVDDLTDELK